MNTYLIIIEILSLVYNGKNLNDVINNYRDNLEFPKIKNISFGVLRNNFKINFIIDNLAKRIDNQMRMVLQIALFELDYSNKPEYAIVNDVVNLSYELSAKESLKTFINGVLRNYLRKKEELVTKINTDYSLKYNLPNWLINKLKSQNKKDYLAILEGLNFHPALGLRINYRKITHDKYLELLKTNNMEFVSKDNKIALSKPVKVDAIPGFRDGIVSIQDIAAQYIVDILNKNKIKPNKVLDICAAPGGKTCQLLENFNCKVVASDIDYGRLEKIEQNLHRLGLNAKLMLANVLNDDWWNGEQFDFILADVPCSATGTIKRNPDIKINRTDKDIFKFTELQKKIVTNIWKMLSKNGYLLYVTCSLLNEENQDNILWFKNNLTDFYVIDELQILPFINSDSLYYALICKK